MDTIINMITTIIMSIKITIIMIIMIIVMKDTIMDPIVLTMEAMQFLQQIQYVRLIVI